MLDLGWAWSQKEISLDKWENDFEQYSLFVSNNGRHPNKGEGREATWKDIQRMAKQNGKLSIYQIEKLESIGFVWAGIRGRTWSSNFEQILAYVESNNLSLPPANSRLGKWYYHQRENSAKVSH